MHVSRVGVGAGVARRGWVGGRVGGTANMQGALYGAESI
jgi:hypothetical protein